MSGTAIIVIVVVLFLLVLAIGKAFTMWITGMDIAVNQQKTMIKNQEEIIALLGEIADNGKNSQQRQVAAPPVLFRSRARLILPLAKSRPPVAGPCRARAALPSP